MERWFICLFVLATVACNAFQSERDTQTIIATSPTGSIDLLGTEWVLIEQNGALPASPDITLAFWVDKIKGHSGCNQYTTDYGIRNTKLIIPYATYGNPGHFTSTLLGCFIEQIDPETNKTTRVTLNDREEEFHDQLMNRHEIIIDTHVNPPLLTLTSHEATLVFEQIQLPSLTETDWLLERMIIQESPQLSISSDVIGEWDSFIHLLSDGKLEGQVICNDVKGSYEQNGSSIRLHVLLGTERQPCEQEQKEQDTLFIQQLVQVKAVQIHLENNQPNQLFLLDEEGDTLFEFYRREKK